MTAGAGKGTADLLLSRTNTNLAGQTKRAGDRSRHEVYKEGGASVLRQSAGRVIAGEGLTHFVSAVAPAAHCVKIPHLSQGLAGSVTC